MSDVTHDVRTGCTDDAWTGATSEITHNVQTGHTYDAQTNDMYDVLMVGDFTGFSCR